MIRASVWILLVMLGSAGAAAAQAPVDVSIEITGNDSLRRAPLLAAIDFWLEDLRERPDDLGALEDAAYALESHYRSEGFAEARVVGEEIAVEKGRLFRLRVEEGRRRLVGDLLFDGNRAVPSERLAGAFRWSTEGLLGTGREVFTPETVAAGLAAIRLIYRLEGFAEIDVQAEPTERATEDAVRVDLTVRVDQGPRTLVGAIEIEGVPEERAEVLVRSCRVQVGDPFHLRLPAEIRGRVERALADAGFHGGRVEVDAVDEGRRSLRTLVIRVEEGTASYLGEIRIEGNTHTARGWIEARLTVEVGDRYSESALDASRDALLSTGLFSNVMIEVAPMEENPAGLLVRVTVDEKDRLRLSARVGFGTYELGRLGLEARQRNLLGVGLTGGVRGKVSFRGEEAEVELRYPFLLDQSLSIAVRAGYERFERISFESQEVSGTVQADYDWNDSERTSLGYQLRDEQIRDPDPGLDPSLTEDTRSAELFLAHTSEHRDSILDPRSGIRAFGRVSYAGPGLGSTLEYVRFRGDLAWAWTWFGDVRLVLSVRGGAIDALQGDDLPLTELFFRGGGRSLRSFRDEKFSPRDAAGNEVGAEAFLEGSAELRFPIYRKIGGAVFVDTGSVVEDYEEFGGG